MKRLEAKCSVPSCLLKETQDDNEKCAELMQIAAVWERSVGVEVSADKSVMMLMKGSCTYAFKAVAYVKRVLRVDYGL